MKVPTRRGETNSLAKGKGVTARWGPEEAGGKTGYRCTRTAWRRDGLGKAAEHAESRSHQEGHHVDAAGIRGKRSYLFREICPGVTCDRATAEIVTTGASNDPGLPDRGQQRS